MRLSYIAAALPLALAPLASAAIFVSTGQTGAQVQCDVNHTQHWTYSVSADVADISGALLTMKRGSQTTASIGFVIFEGLFSDFGTATNLMSITLSPAAFTQSFSPVEFSGTPFNLIAGRTYTAVLFSSAVDSQSEAYFIKGGSETPLRFVDETGTNVTTGGQISPPVPAPGALALLGLAGFIARRRR
jgi:MYXO-CTERM domain-containing protein